MIVKADDDGQRLDRFLKKHFPHIAFGQMQKLLRTGQVRVDGKRAKGETRLEKGQELRLPPMLSNTQVATKTSDKKDQVFIKSLVIFEDEDLVAINKPAGLAVQGGSGIAKHIDGMLDGLTGANGVRPKLVHRLDKDTSGVLLMARSAETARRLAESFSGRDVEKIYWAITSPAPKDNEGRIDAPLAKGESGSAMEKMMEDDTVGKSAITDYVVKARGQNAGLVEFHPLTGRTHQIRVHASIIGCPLWGDEKYDGARGKTFFLHARELVLEHPKKGGNLRLSAPLPDAFKAQAKALGLTLPE